MRSPSFTTLLSLFLFMGFCGYLLDYPLLWLLEVCDFPSWRRCWCTDEPTWLESTLNCATNWLFFLVNSRFDWARSST